MAAKKTKITDEENIENLSDSDIALREEAQDNDQDDFEDLPEDKADLSEYSSELHKDALSEISTVVDTEKFEWHSLDGYGDSYTPEERSGLEAIYDATLSSITQHEVVDGTVVEKNNREVVVNIGFKSEGVISISEFRYNPDLKVGDKVEVYIEIQEDKNGQLVLSHKKARIVKAWDKVNTALNTGEVLKGYVKCRTKGGLIVDVFGIETFLPGSQIDIKPIRDYDLYVGKTMEFKVVKINKEFKNIVVSHKALIESELEGQRKEIISKLEIGQVLEGTVKNITSYGVFMDLGGVDGLIHITDLAWGRISHPEEVVKLDQKINVVILDFDDKKSRIQLGLKQLAEHPWNLYGTKLNIGDKVKGKVVVVADYGAFIEIYPGIEGLIHVSEMSWSQHLRSAQSFLKVGDEIEAVILTLDKEDRKMSMGIKQLVPDPWKGVEKKYPVGSKHKGTIRNFTNYGIFVELEEGIDGLIHISDMSWSKKIKHPSEFATMGDEIEVVILELNTDERKVSLGHKQLEENPWEVFETIFTVDSTHQATITSIAEKGAIVILPYGVEAFAPSRHLVKEDGKPGVVDETLNFKILEFSKENKRILVSHTNTYSEIRKEETENKKPETKSDASEKKKKSKAITKAVKKVRDGLAKTTLGDLDSGLSELKTAVEKKSTSTKKEKE